MSAPLSELVEKLGEALRTAPTRPPDFTHQSAEPVARDEDLVNFRHPPKRLTHRADSRNDRYPRAGPFTFQLPHHRHGHQRVADAGHHRDDYAKPFG